MANEEHLAILKQGVEVWNRWREETHPPILSLLHHLKDSDDSVFDFSGAELMAARLMGADLSGVNLRGANLREAFLARANLYTANLTSADLKNANLFEANLKSANLLGANLVGTNLVSADITAANLSEVNLSEANLYFANFNGSVLREAQFSKASLAGTIFSFTDLSTIIGIETISHGGPSSIGMETIYMSKGQIPEDFLRSCGLSDIAVEYAKLSNPDLSNEEINKILNKTHHLRATQSLQISPLFISYSHSDGTFVDKLEGHLNKRGIRFWRDVHDMKSGRIETQIDRAIRQNPTVLLILSENSLKSDWVEHEVRTARELEKEMSRDVLCPVALDDSWKSSPWPRRVMEQVMEYNILDFSTWEDDSKFGSTFNKLIDGLELFYKG